MAAIQLPASQTAKLNEEHKAGMKKLIEKVNDEATSEDTKKQGLVTTQCYIYNNHKVRNTKMRFLYSKNWVGDSNLDRRVSQILDWNNYGSAAMFYHEGQDGSAAGFVYADGDADDTTARKHTRIFHCFTFINEAGPMGPVDWDAVKFKLDSLCGSISEHEGPVFKGVAIAYFTPELHIMSPTSNI